MVDVKRIIHKKRPPETIRYCKVCLENTKWIYNHLLSHSECSVCGFRIVSDKLINYEGKVMEISNYDKEDKIKKRIPLTFLHRLLKKSVICKLVNSDILEGTLLWFTQYEIMLMVDDEEVLIFKHAVASIKNKSNDS